MIRAEQTGEDKRSMSIEDARKLLPKVGDRLRKQPVSLKDSQERVEPAWCEVVYVNRAHLWYIVQFQQKGNRFREGYKVP